MKDEVEKAFKAGFQKEAQRRQPQEIQLKESEEGASIPEIGGGLIGGLGGGGVGATLGASLGSIVPGIGTAIGGTLGSIAGGYMGGGLGQNVGDAFDWD